MLRKVSFHRGQKVLQMEIVNNNFFFRKFDTVVCKITYLIKNLKFLEGLLIGLWIGLLHLL